MNRFHVIEYWQELSWFSTGGTRAKKYVQSFDGKYYYFKRSEYKPATGTKPEKDFKYEFWSEIIAYEIGNALGFNVLQYDLAHDGVDLGCISESMIDSNEEDLNEGVKYLQAFAPEYQPNNKDHRNRYSFQFIEKALIAFNFQHFTNNILEIIVFDAIIGNGDRHQENWAIISEYAYRYSTSLNDLKEPRPQRVIGFAPIYDNGSSLGRELTEVRITKLLGSEDELNKYVNRGLAEIHWNGEKVSHFKLIEHLLGTSHKEKVEEIIKRVVHKFNGIEIETIVNRIDISTPEFLSVHKIPSPRKQLIVKLVTLRIQRLKELINA